MKKIRKLTAISMQGHMYYRTSFFLNLLSPAVLLAGQYLLWFALYSQQGGKSIGGMAQKEMFSYILLAYALSNLLGWSAENTLAKEIKNGTVAARCIRPVSFLGQSVSEMLGAVLLQGTVNLLLVILAFLCLGRYLAFPALQGVLCFLPCMLLSVFLRILLIDVCSLLCFFSTGYLGISWTRTALFDFFSGAMIPVALFPGWLKTISYATPFPYMLQVPIAVLLGQELPVDLVTVYGLQLLWLFIFLGLHRLIYGQVRRNMNIAGG